MKKLVWLFLLLVAPSYVLAEGVQSNLTQAEAQARAARLSDIRYDVTLQLDQSESFSGEVSIRFALRGPAEDLRLDFFHGEILALAVNGKSARVNRTPTYLLLSREDLRAGANVVNVTFRGETQTNGTGLHRFEDPEDKSVFLYTQFEAFYAHKLFPCFDQPDLKAKLTLAVRAPKSWTVVTATQETKVTREKNFRFWQFAETSALSTYLFSLHAGPFRVWKDSFENIPLRLLARPSMAKYVQPSFWFRNTKQGLKFFNEYFAYPYPFKKYDQLILPEFNAGAMENVGAVTFSERYLSRGKMSRAEERDIVSTLLHEMAHMWFGDLVTMRWWNGLWLNESFATYMSALAMHEATPYREAWKEFFGTKIWAYHQDQLSTTHPIEGEVSDTNAALSAFDGITYGKGAAVLKQLHHWLGKEAFRDGMRLYMRSHAFQNAELKDFIAALQKFSPKDLSAWANVWMRQSGVDTVKVESVCNAGKLESLVVRSDNLKNDLFRPQNINLAFFEEVAGKLVFRGTKPVELTQAEQRLDFSLDCPALVYPNYEDHGYLKVSLSAEAVSVLARTISSLTDPLLRYQLWSNLWQMVLDEELELERFGEIALPHLAQEKDLLVLTFLLEKLSGSSATDGAHLVAYLPPQIRERWITKIETSLTARMQVAAAGSDAQQLWWDSYVRLASSPKAVVVLRSALNGRSLPRGLRLDQDRRWSVIQQLCRKQAESCEAMVMAELKRDHSDWAESSALAARALAPDKTMKERLLLEALDSSLSWEKREAIAERLYPYEQKFFAAGQEDILLEYFRKNMRTGDLDELAGLAEGLNFLDCSGDGAVRLERFLAESPEMPSTLARTFREMLDEDRICRGVRAEALGK